MMKWLKEMNPNLRLKLRKLLTTFSITALAGLIIFSYLSNIEIDEGTTAMYQALDNLFMLFIVLLVVFLIPTVMFIIYDIKYYKQINKGVRKSKLNKQIHTFDVFNFSFMLTFMFLSVFPIFYVLAGSFNQGADYAIGGVYFLPRVFTFENYRVVLQNPDLWQGYLITFLRTSVGTISALLYTAIVAYAMSRNNLRFKKGFYWINIVTMFFAGGLVPYFLIIRMVGLYDTFAVYIIPGLYSVYHMIIMSTFFKTISNELHEAAYVDGANEFRIFWQIYMPLSKPVLATIALWLAIGHWNAYFDTMIFTNNPNLQTLQYFLLKAIQTSTLTEGMPPEMMMRLSPKTLSLAAIIISIIPVLFFFPFVRKNFQSGIMIGSLKG